MILILARFWPAVSGVLGTVCVTLTVSGPVVSKCPGTRPRRGGIRRRGRGGETGRRGGEHGYAGRGDSGCASEDLGAGHSIQNGSTLNWVIFNTTLGAYEQPLRAICERGVNIGNGLYRHLV